MQGFHPDIDLCGQQAYLSFHMADLTASPQACCAPLLSKQPLLTVRTHKVTPSRLVGSTALHGCHWLHAWLPGAACMLSMCCMHCCTEL